MRAVALSDSKIQKTIVQSFIPLKIVMTYPPKMDAFPLDWPAMRSWRLAYKLTGGQGFTGCSVVSPDLTTEYGSTGSAMVWELFDSIAYDADKFQEMLDQSIEFATEAKAISKSRGPGKRLKLLKLKSKMAKANRASVRLPPKGFSIERAKELFRMTGDLSSERDSK